MDIPWERIALARFMPSMSLADPAMDETRGPEARRHDQSGPCRQAARRLGPYLRARSSTRPNAGKPLPHFAIPATAQGDRRREARRRRLAERRGHAAGLRPEAQGRVRRFHGTPRSPGHRQADQRRRDLQRRDGQRLGHRRHARRRRHAQGERHEAAPIGAVRRGDGRGEGPARLEVLRQRPDGRSQGDRRQSSIPTCSCRSSRSRS